MWQWNQRMDEIELNTAAWLLSVRRHWANFDIKLSSKLEVRQKLKVVIKSATMRLLISRY